MCVLQPRPPAQLRCDSVTQGPDPTSYSTLLGKSRRCRPRPCFSGARAAASRRWQAVAPSHPRTLREANARPSSATVVLVFGETPERLRPSSARPPAVSGVLLHRRRRLTDGSQPPNGCFGVQLTGCSRAAASPPSPLSFFISQAAPSGRCGRSSVAPDMFGRPGQF
jgi:hypothetical protein